MICTTIRNGNDCAFMTQEGCSYNGGACHQIIEKCEGCNRSAEFEAGWYCTACPDPNTKWKYDHCNFATHVKAATANSAKKVNPLKASKRANR